jgi:muramoyltetrapeptide carboxypeptidase
MTSPILPRGARIAVVAPAGIHDPERLERGFAIARSYGAEIDAFPDLLRPFRYLASNDDQRASQLMQALSSPDHAAVWIARGGYGLTRILDRIDPAAVVPDKVVIGFSDMTALFCLLHQHGVGRLIHGPVLHSLPITDPGAIEHLFALLAGETVPPLEGEPWILGAAEGQLVGGNLSLIAALCGTPWQLDARGKILVIEEVGEAPYRVDRLMQQLLSAGVLDDVAGVAFGDFTDCTPPEGAAWTLREVLLDHVGRLAVPVAGNLPIGHGARNRAFQWGTVAHLSGGRLTLS